MARQTFEKGQTVYVAYYSRHNWRKAVVATPDVVKQSFGYYGKRRDIHYVGICYVKDDGTVDVDRTWDVLNNRRRIVTEEAHAEIKQAKDIGELRQAIDAHRAFETDFARYVEQARIIVGTLPASEPVGSSEINKLAHYLRGMFSFRSEYRRSTNTEVRALRADYRADAADARAALKGLGVEAPELP
jgi:hypothetical protein